MKQDTYELSVLVKGRKIPEYNHENDHYVEGREGSEFVLELKNNSNKRVLMVPSVDGLSILDGKPMHDESSGYVVAPYQTMKIPGWTLNNDAVAHFAFAQKKSSYAANHSENPSTENVGAIGVLVYSEKVKPQDQLKKIKKDKTDPWDGYPWDRRNPWRPYEPFWIGGITNTYMADSSSVPTKGSKSCLRSSGLDSIKCSASFAASNSSASASASVNTSNTVSDWIEQQSVVDEQSFALGTEFGKKTDFGTVNTTFAKDTLVATLIVYYDTRKNLEKLGIKFPSKAEPRVKPNPFPNVKHTGCVPPKDWKEAT